MSIRERDDAAVGKEATASMTGDTYYRRTIDRRDLLQAGDALADAAEFETWAYDLDSDEYRVHRKEAEEALRAALARWREVVDG